MTANLANQPSSRKSYLRVHGVAIALSCVLSCTLTVLVVLGVQSYFSKLGKEAGQQRLAESLPGKWELIESVPPSSPGIKAGEEWWEFRPDGTLKTRSFTTIAVNDKVTDQNENLQVLAYKVVDAEHILLNPGGQEHLIRVVLVGDELTLHKQFGEVGRYRRAAK